ncbi:unnamed protein product [Absidia cylindrospora]
MSEKSASPIPPRSPVVPIDTNSVDPVAAPPLPPPTSTTLDDLTSQPPPPPLPSQQTPRDYEDNSRYEERRRSYSPRSRFILTPAIAPTVALDHHPSVLHAHPLPITNALIITTIDPLIGLHLIYRHVTIIILMRLTRIMVVLAVDTPCPTITTIEAILQDD